MKLENNSSMHQSFRSLRGHEVTSGGGDYEKGEFQYKS